MGHFSMNPGQNQGRPGRGRLRAMGARRLPFKQSHSTLQQTWSELCEKVRPDRPDSAGEIHYPRSVAGSMPTGSLSWKCISRVSRRTTASTEWPMSYLPEFDGAVRRCRPYASDPGSLEFPGRRRSKKSLGVAEGLIESKRYHREQVSRSPRASHCSTDCWHLANTGEHWPAEMR